MHKHGLRFKDTEIKLAKYILWYGFFIVSTKVAVQINSYQVICNRHERGYYLVVPNKAYTQNSPF